MVMGVLFGLLVVTSAATACFVMCDEEAARLTLMPAIRLTEDPRVTARVTEVEVGGFLRSIVAVPLTGPLYVKRGRKYELVQGKAPEGQTLYRRVLKGNRPVYTVA